MESTAGKKKITNRVLWLDCAKSIAMFAVIIDHTNMHFYVAPSLQRAGFFSVTLFILLAGITSWHSNARIANNYNAVKQSLIHKFNRIFIPYVIASFFLLIVKNHHFDLTTFLHSVIFFTADPVLYFVFFYLQLLLISRYIYRAFSSIRSNKKWIQITGSLLFFLVTIYCSIICIKYTQMLPLHGGGAFLFGGSYLFVFCLGMLLGSYQEYFQNVIINWRRIFILLFLLFFYIWIYLKNNFQIDSHLPFGAGINPPGVSLMIYALLVLTSVYAITRKLKKNILSKRCLEFIAFFGKESLYIYLYHRAFIIIIAPFITLNAPLAVRLFSILSVFIAPALISAMWRRIYKFLCSFFSPVF